MNMTGSWGGGGELSVQGFRRWQYVADWQTYMSTTQNYSDLLNNAKILR
jgi:hypothetical protein